MKNREKIIHVGIIIVTIGIAMAFWPLQWVRIDVSSRSDSTDCAKTGRLKDGRSVRQTFIPSEDYLRSIWFAITFAPIEDEDAVVVFELYDKAENLLTQCDINMTQVSDGRFFPVSIEQKVSTKETYTWVLYTKNWDTKAPKVMYTTEPIRGVEENQRFIIHSSSKEKEVAGQAVVQYDYRAGLSADRLACVFTWLITAALLLMAYFHRKNKKEFPVD